MWLHLKETDSVEMPAWKRSAIRFRSLFQHFELETSSSVEHPLVTGWLGLNQISLWLVDPRVPHLFQALSLIRGSSRVWVTSLGHLTEVTKFRVCSEAELGTLFQQNSFSFPTWPPSETHSTDVCGTIRKLQENRENSIKNNLPFWPVFPALFGLPRGPVWGPGS